MNGRFTQMNGRLNLLEDQMGARFNQLEEDQWLDHLEELIQEQVVQPLMQTRILATKTHNFRCGNGLGAGRQYVEVPREDGHTPGEEGLPVILNVGNFMALTGPQLTAYLQFYGVPGPNATLLERRVRLARCLNLSETFLIPEPEE
ncbi:hypothetical protein BC829DRAFT_386504 [Chytridium lagenaria]|nr:hypothetical protein BC829DRAFT_386504 [Chytridium lagenaria]